MYTPYAGEVGILLLKKGTHTINDGGFPLAMAAQQGHFGTVHRLLEVGVNINHQAEVMRTDS